MEKSRPTALVLIWAVIIVCSCIELVLLQADFGGIGPPRLRQTAYEYGGFWPGLLTDWRANFAGQPVIMFVSYGFLHGGPVHLIVNMITLWSLGAGVMERVGARGFAVLYLISLLGGAGGYALLSTSPQPMVGASGALFGLAGGLSAWLYIDRFAQSLSLWPILRIVLLLVAMNVAMWWALDGNLAWQTHLGGFITGWIAALLVNPTPRTD